MKEYALTEAEQASLAAIDTEIQDAIQAGENQSRGMLRLILRQQGLEGTWTLSVDKSKLVRKDQEA